MPFQKPCSRDTLLRAILCLGRHLVELIATWYSRDVVSKAHRSTWRVKQIDRHRCTHVAIFSFPAVLTSTTAFRFRNADHDNSTTLLKSRKSEPTAPVILAESRKSLKSPSIGSVCPFNQTIVLLVSDAWSVLRPPACIGLCHDLRLSQLHFSRL